ncbi:MAG: YitT family protein [Chloroflexota bacterium]
MKMRLQNFLSKTFWPLLRDYALIFLGALLQALAIRLFLVPADLVSGGVSGIAQIVNHFTGWPIGLMIFLGNLPIFLIGWRYLGGVRFALRTAFAVIVVSVLTDLPIPWLPESGITHDLVLNALYGGVVSGIGFGLVYRGQGTSGGSDILARIINHWRGVPISQSYLWTDSIVMLLGGLTFSWENALYAVLNLYVSGLAAEAVVEGENVVRTAMIITTQPQAVADKIMLEMARGVTLLHGQGAYTQTNKEVLYCVISRAEINQLKTFVQEADPGAFMVIGHAYEALGEGFRKLKT